MKLKIVCFFISTLFLFSCAEEESTNEEESTPVTSETGVEFYNKEFKVNSNLDSSKYLIKIDDSSQNNSRLIASSLSSDSQSGFVYALNSSDQIVNLFDPFNSGELKDITKKGNSSILVGEFIKDSVTCLVVVSGDSSSTCLVTKQGAISSVGATFLKDENQIALLVDNSNTGKKELYLYNTNDGFIGVSSASQNSIQPLKFDLSGSINNSFASNDYAAFYIKGDNSGELLFLKNNGSAETKTNSVTSDSVQDVNGEPIFMSNGNLRMGFDKSISYNQSSNNRTVSTNNVLVDIKDAKFQFYYQSDYTFQNFSNPSIFYLKPKRSDLPLSYPDYTLERIKCCQAKNNPSGTRDNVEEMNWIKVAGYKNFVIAYGKFAGTNYPEYSSTNIVIDKAIILINANSYDAEPLGDAMARISLYDYNNTSSEEDNLINPLSYDSITSVVNYTNGFKFTGTKYGQEKTTYYNPATNNIEFPSTSDQQSFTIKASL